MFAKVQASTALTHSGDSARLDDGGLALPQDSAHLEAGGVLTALPSARFDDGGDDGGLAPALPSARCDDGGLARVTMGFTPERLLPLFFSKKGWWK